MRAVLFRLLRTGGICLVGLAVFVAFAVAFHPVRLPWGGAAAEKADPPSKEPLAVELVAGRADSLLVPEDVQQSLGIRQGDTVRVAVARRPTATRPLVMPGSTALDPARLIRVRVRFAPAEVVEMGQIDDPHGSPGIVPPLRRDLQVGDAVKKGQLLAVLYSIDVGNKKDDLFDALCQLRLDEEVLRRAEARSAAVPEVFLLTARRSVQADVSSINRAENTLKTWAVPEADIQAVREEVKKITSTEDRRARERQNLKQWARVELRAPENGFIIEQNVALHEMVVDNTTNLLQIAQVDPLVVLSAVPEDDLPALQALKARTGNLIAWTVATVGTEPVRGLIDDIGYLIDPNQHTAVVRGHIGNPGGVLRAGQFVTATVQLLPPSDVVEVPIGAVVEDGKDSIVFVQSDPAKPVYTMRRVEVANRFDRMAYVRSVLPAADSRGLPDVDGQPSPSIEPLREGERVLTTGALELKTALASKLSEATGS
jgi:cobalt-zinc-cadmium efflux system membrane fusion protein